MLTEATSANKTLLCKPNCNITFHLLFAGCLGLEAKANSHYQGVGIPVPLDSPSANKLMPCHGCFSMFHMAVGHMEPQDIQQQLESKIIEAKVRMQAFIWIVQPASFPSNGKECSQDHLPWSPTFSVPV